MADVDALTQQYLVRAADNPLALPEQFDESTITPLIDAVEYYPALEAALALVGTGATPADNAGHYILIHGWWLGLAGGRYARGTNPGSAAGFVIVDEDPFYLDGPVRSIPTPAGGTKPLIDILKAKARVGVDVRVMGWLLTGISSNIFAMIGGAKAIGHVNAMTLRAVQALREEPTIGLRAIVNAIAHPGGAAHTKLAVIGNRDRAVGFTGGIDFVNTRWGTAFHEEGTWHDAVAQVEGRAVRGLYEWFRSMYEENRAREPKQYRINKVDVAGHDQTATPALAAFTAPTAAAVGAHRVQNLRTVPQFEFSLLNVLPSPDPISFAPEGLFEFRSGLKKAISGAQQYVYLEDQGMWSVEVMSWVHDAIVANPTLKAIIVNGGIDPNDPTFPPGYIARAMNIGLLRGGDETKPELDTSQRARARFFSRLKEELLLAATIEWVTEGGGNFAIQLDVTSPENIPTNKLADLNGQVRQGSNVFTIVSHDAIAIGQKILLAVAADKYDPGNTVNPSAGPCELYLLTNLTMHAKLAIVDDAVAIIGSGNVAMRRSLYTDLENSVSFVDPAETLVRDLRCKLWAGHLLLTNPGDLTGIEGSLHVWNPGWGTADPALPARRPPHILERALPLSAPPLGENNVDTYDDYIDGDSRDSWGGLCPTIPSGSSLS
jgi:phosphatidylserine/phosphatidylglycerophosphate/cardiolipin synthase-like enzyme